MIRVELALLLRRPRTWVSLLLLAGLPTIVAVFLHATHVAPRPGQGTVPFLSQVLTNGALFPAAALGIVLTFLLPASVAVVAGDTIAGDASAGTLRYLLIRPVGRTRLLVAKLVSVLVFVLLAVVVVAGVGYLVGTGLFGSHPLPTLSGGPPLTVTQSLLRVVLSVVYVGVSMLGLAAMAVFLSTLTNAPLGATLGAIAVLVTSTVLDALDAAESVRPYLPTHYWFAFVDLFRQPVLWRGVQHGLALQAVYVGVLLLASWATFTTRDVTS